jgi:hypothetical protein
MPKLSPSFTFTALFALTETPFYEYNRIDSLYHPFYDTALRSLSLPVQAWKEEGRILFRPTKQ